MNSSQFRVVAPSTSIEVIHHVCPPNTRSGLHADCMDFNDGSSECMGSGWYFWFCQLGCIPDSELFGPFETEELALAAAKEDYLGDHR